MLGSSSTADSTSHRLFGPFSRSSGCPKSLPEPLGVPARVDALLLRRFAPSNVLDVTLSSSDIAAIRAAEKGLAAALEAPDPTAWLAYYTEDAIFSGPGAATIAGRAGLLEIASRVVISSMQISVDSTIGDGDFAATFGRATWVNGTKGSDAPVVRRRLLMVWRRETDGQWRIARELLNEDG